MSIQYPAVGICGLACRLCPSYHAQGESRCAGCKSANRMAAGCPFITCAVKRKQIEFCWECDESETCIKWRKHRQAAHTHDSFVCYQKLEDNIAAIRRDGVKAFEKVQRARETLLRTMLQDYNDGRSKTYYCIAATVLEVDELQAALSSARERSAGLEIKTRSRILHGLLNEIAARKHYVLKLRKQRT